MTTTKERRKPGPKAEIGPTEVFNNRLPERHIRVLKALAAREHISTVAALRMVIEHAEKKLKIVLD